MSERIKTLIHLQIVGAINGIQNILIRHGRHWEIAQEIKHFFIPGLIIADIVQLKQNDP
ncbi:hypothetical protein D3C81_1611170 [compost metagenome]